MMIGGEDPSLRGKAERKPTLMMGMPTPRLMACINSQVPERMMGPRSGQTSSGLRRQEAEQDAPNLIGETGARPQTFCKQDVVTNFTILPNDVARLHCKACKSSLD